MSLRRGSALLMVLLLMTGVSMLLINLNYRFSLLVQTVVQREKQLQLYCAAQAVMFYAIQLAKHNWDEIHMRLRDESIVYRDVPWHMRSDKIMQASISYEKSGEALFVTIELCDDKDHRKESISCKVTAENRGARDVQLMILDWKER